MAKEGAVFARPASGKNSKTGIERRLAADETSMAVLAC